MKTILTILVAIIIIAIVITGVKKSEDLPQPTVEVATTTNQITDGAYTVSSSTLIWSGKKTLVTGYVDSGVVTLKSGEFTVNNGSIASGTLVVDMNSISVKGTGRGDDESLLEKHLKSKDFFNSSSFSTSTLIIKRSEGNVIYGDLIVKGITKPVQFPADISVENSMVKIKGVMTVDRTEYDIRYGSNKFFDNLANNVIDDLFTIEFELVGVKKE